MNRRSTDFQVVSLAVCTCGHSYLLHNYTDGSLRVLECSAEDCKCFKFVESSTDVTVNHSSHYTSHPSGVECIQITEWMSFNVGNAVKYLWRADEKGALLEDLKKAVWYINREIERRKSDA